MTVHVCMYVYTYVYICTTYTGMFYTFFSVENPSDKIHFWKLEIVHAASAHNSLTTRGRENILTKNVCLNVLLSS